jgi:hypothetical protein
MGPLAFAIPAGLQFLGGLFGGAQQGKMAQAQLGEQQREFNLPLEYQLSRYQQAGPMRDQASRMLMARMGGSPGAPGSFAQNPTVNSIMGALQQPQQQGWRGFVDQFAGAHPQQPDAGPWNVKNRLGGQRMPYYGPANAGTMGGSGGVGY